MKPREDFTGTTRRHSYCKPCFSSYVLSRDNRPMYQRRRKVMKIIPTITEGELDHIIDKCTHTCQICGADTTSKATHLDHDEVRKIIRGWLCHRCNVGIGFFKDNPDVMRRAAEYLETANLLADYDPGGSATDVM